jgi:hypothetical protein
MDSILAESKNYLITNEYEMAFLNFKNSDKKICIGDFYGDPQVAIISNDETICVMAGCGIIVYYLKEPFEEYKYNSFSKQWKELFREKGNEKWIDDVDFIDATTIEITIEETNEKMELDI